MDKFHMSIYQDFSQEAMAEQKRIEALEQSFANITKKKFN